MSAMKRLFSALGPTGLGLGVAMGGLGWSALSPYAIAASEGQERQELPKVLVITAVGANGNAAGMRSLEERIQVAWADQLLTEYVRLDDRPLDDQKRAEITAQIERAERIVFIDVLWGDTSNPDHAKAQSVEPVARLVAAWWNAKDTGAVRGMPANDLLLDGRMWAERYHADYFEDLLELLGASSSWLVVATDHSSGPGQGFPMQGANTLLVAADVPGQFRADNRSEGVEQCVRRPRLAKSSGSTCSIQITSQASWVTLAKYKSDNAPAIIRRRRSVEWNPTAKVVEIMIPDDCERITAAVVDRRLARVRAGNIAGAKQVWTAGATGQSTPPQSRIHSVPWGDLTTPPTHPSGQALLVVFETASGSHERWLELPEVE